MTLMSSAQDILRLPRRGVGGVRRHVARERKFRAELARHNKRAEVAYHGITSQFPDRALTVQQERMIQDYSADVLGHPLYAPWLRVYAAWRGEFLEGWIPETFQVMRIMPKLQGRYREISMLRCLQGRLFGPGYFPDLICCVNGTWISPYDDGQVFTAAEVTKILFAYHEVVFVKYEHTHQSKGVHRLTREIFDAAAIAAKGDCVVQAPIQQETSLAAFMPDNVATLRITTYRPAEGPARKRAAFMRFGRAGQDNYASKTHIFSPIRDEQGYLCDDAAIAGSRRRIFAHPDTNIVFAGYRVPQFATAVALCERLHDRLPLVPLVGWDVGIDTENQVQVMEWNTRTPGISYTEPMIGPSFTDLGWEKLCR